MPVTALHLDNACERSGCMAPVYLDGYCAACWRLLIGYAGHARMRDEDERRRDTDPLERLFAI